MNTVLRSRPVRLVVGMVLLLVGLRLLRGVEPDWLQSVLSWIYTAALVFAFLSYEDFEDGDRT